MKPVSVMAGAVVTSSGKSALVLVPTGVTKVCVEKDPEEMSSLVGEASLQPFQWDGATWHRSNMTQQWSKNKLPAFGPRRCGRHRPNIPKLWILQCGEQSLVQVRKLSSPRNGRTYPGTSSTAGRPFRVVSDMSLKVKVVGRFLS